MACNGGANVGHLVSTGDGSTSSVQRGPSGRQCGIHLQEGQRWEVNRDFFQLKCCRLSHAVSRGWTFAFFPWQAALKAAHAASQIVLGDCTSLPHQVFGFTTHSCWCLLTGEQQNLLRFYVCLNFCPTLTRLVWRPVEILSLHMCSWIGISQVWEEGAWSCSKQPSGARVLVLKWQMAKKGCSMAQEGGNISKELIYRKRKWCKADNDRTNKNKLLAIDAIISRHGNEDGACKYEWRHAHTQTVPLIGSRQCSKPG